MPERGRERESWRVEANHPQLLVSKQAERAVGGCGKAANVRLEWLTTHLLYKVVFNCSATIHYMSRRQRISVASSPFFPGFTCAAWSYPSLTLIGSCAPHPNSNYSFWAVAGDDAKV